MRFGPVSEAPSRLQRYIVAGPTVVLSLFTGFLGASLSVVFLLVRTGPDYRLLILWLGAFCVGSTVFHIARRDRHETREERLAKRVMYVSWGLPPIVGPSQRRLAFVSLGLLALLLIRGLVGLFQESVTTREVAWLLVMVVSMALLARMLTRVDRDLSRDD
jgi:hypothetical protein